MSFQDYHGERSVFEQGTSIGNGVAIKSIVPRAIFPHISVPPLVFIQSTIREYTQRSLTYSSDALNAFLGVLSFNTVPRSSVLWTKVLQVSGVYPLETIVHRLIGATYPQLSDELNFPVVPGWAGEVQLDSMFTAELETSLGSPVVHKHKV